MKPMQFFYELGWPGVFIILLLLILLNVALTPSERFKHDYRIIIDLPLKYLIELIILSVITFLIGYSI